MSPQGYYLTKRKQNSGYYYIGIRQEGGKIRWRSLHTKSKTDAMRLFKNFVPPPTIEREQVCVGRLRELISERAKDSLRSNTLETYLYTLDLFIKEVGADKPLSQITLEDIERFKKSLIEKKLAPTTINIHLRSLKSCFGRAVKWEYIERNPVLRVSLMKIIKTPPRFLSREDFAELLKVVKEPLLQDIFTFAVHTAMRLSEISHLRWHFVDINARNLTIANQWNFETKSGRQRTIPATSTVVDILKKQLKNRKGLTAYVFQRNGFRVPQSYITHKFREYCDKSKLPSQIHFHSLRHTAISWMLMSGMSIFDVARIAGHSDTSLVDKVYGHLTQEHKVSQINKLQQYIDK